MRTIIILGMLFLGGCSFKEAPVMKSYTIAAPQVAPAASSTHYRNRILKVSYPVALNEKLDENMYYSYSLTDRGSYLNSRWANSAGRMLQGDFIQILSAARLFKVVVPYASDVDEDYRLESTVFDLSHHVRGERSYAVLTIQFTLMDTKTGQLVKARRFTYQEATGTVDAKGYAAAVNRIMTKLARDLVEWLQ